MIYFITGGERSGKSSYAQSLALALKNTPIYLATAKKWDDDFEKRIARHKSERDERWTNIEEEKYIAKAELAGNVVVLDCITLWLTNIFMDAKNDVDDSLSFAKEELRKAFKLKCTWIIISNEIGMGVHAPTEMGRKFVELQGWTNQFIAAKADEVTLMVSGIPLIVKQSKDFKKNR
jgi:adenosylcobinamide kinase/adenosylcobinamide-phosphate guanylyltransferase